jgi:hypothetical protein
MGPPLERTQIISGKPEMSSGMAEAIVERLIPENLD